MLSSKIILYSSLLLLIMGCTMEEPPTPVAKIGVTGGNCIGPCTVIFSDASTNTSVYEWNYQWEFGDGEKSTAKNPTHKYQNGGNYKVKFILTGKYGTSSDTTTVVIKGVPAEPPAASFTVTGGNCDAPCEVTFTNTSTRAVSYSWNFGDKSADSVSKLESPKHTFQKDGTFAVKLTAVGAGGTNSKSEMVVIKLAVPLAADFTSSQELSSDSIAVTFKNKSTSAVKYDWDFGDGKSSHDADPVHKYENKDGSFTVSLKAYDKANASKTKTETLTITKK